MKTESTRTLPGPYYCLHCKEVVQQGQQIIVSVQRIDEAGYYIPGTPLVHLACAIRAASPMSVSQPMETGTTVRPRSCVGSGRLYALPTTGTFSDPKANRVWHVSVDDSSGLQSVAYASCPDCGALVQIVNERISEHYGR